MSTKTAYLQRDFGAGPDLMQPGTHWRKIITAMARERGITNEESAEAIVKMYAPQFHNAIRESAKP